MWPRNASGTRREPCARRPTDAAQSVAPGCAGRAPVRVRGPHSDGRQRPARAPQKAGKGLLNESSHAGFASRKPTMAKTKHTSLQAGVASRTPHSPAVETTVRVGHARAFGLKAFPDPTGSGGLSRPGELPASPRHVSFLRGEDLFSIFPDRGGGLDQVRVSGTRDQHLCGVPRDIWKSRMLPPLRGARLPTGIAFTYGRYFAQLRLAAIPQRRLTALR